MKEYPILFNGAMVRAILKGPKEVTRRLDVDRWLKLRKGDRLWVRETWTVFEVHDASVGLGYRADHPLGGDLSKTDGGYSFTYLENPEHLKQARLRVSCDRWRPAIHMYRWASRILLELTEDPRAERLQDITEEDAIAEGVQPWQFNEQQTMTSGELGCVQPFRGGFACEWDDINERADRTWFANPEVAVVRFRRKAA